MKNSILIALFVFATAGIFSCSKSEPVRPQANNSSERTIATDVLSMTFESRTDDNGTAFLQANRSLDGITLSDINSHHVFIYAISAVGGQTHKLLPISVASDDANYTISSNLNDGTLSVRIDSDAQDQAINAEQFQGMQFQVLLVSAEDYSRLQEIDWSDYFAVFAAIRSMPLPAVHLESDSQAGSNN